MIPSASLGLPEARVRSASPQQAFKLNPTILCLAGGWLLATSAIQAQTESRTLPRSPVRQVIVVFKTHFDIGYTDFASNIVARYRTTMIDQALEVAERNRDLPAGQKFVWTVPGWPAFKILEDWPGQTFERRTSVQRAFQEGRFYAHALPFTLHTELLELEDLTWGLGYSSQLARRLALDLPRDAKMTDVPCHSWIWPTVLKQAGVEFLHLGCNAASRSPDVPRLFWWEGPDGSRVLTMYTAESYGTGLMPPVDWPYQTWLALIHTGDNHGPPRTEEVQQLFREASDKLPGVRVRIGRLSDFADAIVAEQSPIPVVRGDMPDSWIHGPLSDPIGARIARNLRPLIPATESLTALLQLWNVTTDTDSDLALIRENSLLYGEHTWGAALSWVTPYGKNMNWHYGNPWRRERAEGRFKKMEASWEEHSTYIRNVQNHLLPLLEHRMQRLANGIQAKAPRIVVFNPLPWNRGGLVTISNATLSGVQALRPVDGGQAISVEQGAGFLRFVSPEVPGLGYRAFVPEEDLKSSRHHAPRRDADAMENRWFKMEIDSANGCLSSLVDKRSGRELVDPGARHRPGQVLYERFDADQVAAYVKAYVKIDADWGQVELGKPPLPPATEAPYVQAVPRRCQVRYEDSPVAATAVVEAAAEGGLPCPITTRFVLYHDLPYLDVEVTLHGKPADPWPEAGWICFSANLKSPRFGLGRLGAIVNPATDLVPGSNHHVFGVNSGMYMIDPDDHGLGLCPLDSGLISLDSPGLWQYSRQFKPVRSAVYVNLFNNQWSTNFRLWNEGTWTSRVRIWAIDNSEAAKALVTPSWEARLPLLGAVGEGGGGPLPPLGRGITVSRPGVLVTAFGPNPEGEGLVLRLWEQSGQSGSCTVRLPSTLEATQAQPIDLRGRAIGAPHRIRQKAFSTQLQGFAPASYLLRTGVSSTH